MKNTIISAILLGVALIVGLGQVTITVPDNVGAQTGPEHYYTPVFKTGCYGVQVAASSTVIWFNATSTATTTVVGTQTRPTWCKD